jgi:tyrosyl-tRNA synthetase
MPLLEGLDGVNKMSKSLGNYVGITDAPNDMFGKLMSISDELMWRYIELLSFESLATVVEWRRSIEAGRNPRDIKVGFAQEIVARFHDRAAAEAALEDFESRFRHGGVPDEMPEHAIAVPADGMPIAQILKVAGLCPSASDALRMIDQGGVRVDGDKVADKSLRLAPGGTHVIQVGKRKFAKVVLKRAG